MYSLNFSHKNQTKKITLPKNITDQAFSHLISKSFKTQDNIILLTNSLGHLITLQQLKKNPSNYENQVLFVITSQNINEDNMSFASNHNDHKLSQKKNNQYHKNFQFQKNKDSKPNLQIPQQLQGSYQGVIGDLKLFEELCLQESQVTIVFCFVKQKPKNIHYPYYLYHTSRNSAIIYLGTKRVCEFFIQNMAIIPKQIQNFIIGLIQQKNPQQQIQRGKKQKKQSKRESKQQSQKKCSFEDKQQQFYSHEQRGFSKKQKRIHEDYQQKKRNKKQIKSKKNSQIQLQKNNFLGQQIIFNEDQKLLDSPDEQQQQFVNQQLNQQKNNQNNKYYNQNNSDDSQQFNEPMEQGQIYNVPNNQNRQADLKSSLLQNLLQLRSEQEITELQFYKMKSQLLENLSNFMRKYQMKTRKGRRNMRKSQDQKNNIERLAQRITQFNTKPIIINPNRNSKQEQLSEHEQKKMKRNYSKKNRFSRQRQRSPPSKPQSTNKNGYMNQQRRQKKYEIPIIVRKYNNVVQKISTSYPLTQQQQQSINLILQLQLKGLINQKQAGIYKASILQEDSDVFNLFLDYFDGLNDQIQLVTKLKKIKKVNSQKKQRSQHNMRLLIKYSKQGNYELLRNLLLQNNPHVISALQRFRQDKNSQKLILMLEKIAQFNRTKKDLEQAIYVDL